MGLFPSANDFKAGKGVEKDAPRKTGVRRFFELVGRDMNSMFLANLLTCLGFVPVTGCGRMRIYMGSGSGSGERSFRSGGKCGRKRERNDTELLWKQEHTHFTGKFQNFMI